MKTMSAYRRKDILEMHSREVVSETIAKYAEKNLSHLYKITQADIENVLDVIGWYLSEPQNAKTWRMNRFVRKAKPKVFSDTLLTMIQLEHHACGMRIEMWGL